MLCNTLTRDRNAPTLSVFGAIASFLMLSKGWRGLSRERKDTKTKKQQMITIKSDRKKLVPMKMKTETNSTSKDEPARSMRRSCSLFETRQIYMNVSLELCVKLACCRCLETCPIPQIGIRLTYSTTTDAMFDIFGLPGNRVFSVILALGGRTYRHGGRDR